MAPPYVSELTNRLVSLPRIEKTWGPAPTYEISAWVKDELLVSADVDGAVRATLGTLGWAKATSVLAPAGFQMPKKRPGVVDVEVWKPKPTGHPLVVEAVLANLAAAFPGTDVKVSPNHLLVPCVNVGCYCPGGPPRPIKPNAQLAQRIGNYPVAKNKLNVAVIDTGYVRHPALQARMAKKGFETYRAEVLTAGGAWVTSKRDGLYKRRDGKLDLLDGHGTFTAGVIAERCDNAHIRLVGIRAIESAATEAALIRAVYQHAAWDVIVPVFAFHTLQSTAGWTFTNVLPQLADGSVLVCPAGNEASPARHYPAALGWPDYPVIGVGSFVEAGNAAGTPNLSDFSNYGSWLAGYTCGEDVVGPHITTKAKMEDAGSATLNFTGWASWSGTSFATPKVAAAIVARATGPGKAREAAAALVAAGSKVPLGGSAGAGTGADWRALAP